MVHTYMCEGKKGRGLLACRAWVVCFVSKMSICLYKVIPYDLPKYTGLGCPSVESTPPTINTHHHKPRSRGPAFLPPTERIWKGRQSFPFSSFTVRFLDQNNPQMAATRVQQFGCSQTANLTTKQCNRSYWKQTLSRISHVRKRIRTQAHTLTQPGSHSTSPKKSKKPSPSCPGLP